MVEALGGKIVACSDESLLDKEYETAFATDLMSDALALIQDSPETTVLITGLCNPQSLRTAEMLDVGMIVFVRGKKLSDDLIEIAKGMDTVVATSPFTMYETCGNLYMLGLGGIYGYSAS
ncbi:MAG: hypothetical protein K6D03_04825 [Solobacterium sp.]|nr:hypothetical protein [Solobacterium sp.]